MSTAVMMFLMSIDEACGSMQAASAMLTQPGRPCVARRSEHCCGDVYRWYFTWFVASAVVAVGVWAALGLALFIARHDSRPKIVQPRAHLGHRPDAQRRRRRPTVRAVARMWKTRRQRRGPGGQGPPARSRGSGAKPPPLEAENLSKFT